MNPEKKNKQLIFQIIFDADLTSCRSRGVIVLDYVNGTYNSQ